ncbi:MAG: DUF808 domain-containing protein [Alphaproteobacteria bacterium]|nr:DUF808 domain-containing protein [Alphaproteobacteria bacterium]
MPSAGLLALLDDVATLTHAAAQKTAGIAGDDLALNAKALHGLDPARELPIVWKVARGSLLNKAILIPAALILSTAAPWAIMPLMVLGGSYLCFEGVEKLIHAWQHRTDAHPEAEALAVLDDAALEAQKVRSAIRTDLILSAEIIVVSLGAVAAASFMTKAVTLVLIGLIMTVGIYGLVGGLVKLDDIGLHLLTRGRWKKKLGKALVHGAPLLLRLISVLGTVAMFTVGGGIVVHAFPAAEHALSDALHALTASPLLSTLLHMAATGLFGVALGVVCVPMVHAVSKVLRAMRRQKQA